MYTQKEIWERIAAIDETLATGIQTVTVDGTSTTVGLKELRQERDRLLRVYNAGRRPTSASIHLTF